MTEPIKVEGLREWTLAVRKVDGDLAKTIRLALNEAADLVVDDARPKVPTRSGKAARSMKVASTRTKARVSAGGNRAPYYGWIDFGGAVGRSKSIKRTYKPKGRYIFPQYRKLRDSGVFLDVMLENLEVIGHKAGLDIG